MTYHPEMPMHEFTIKELDGPKNAMGYPEPRGPYVPRRSEPTSAVATGMPQGTDQPRTNHQSMRSK